MIPTVPVSTAVVEVARTVVVVVARVFAPGCNVLGQPPAGAGMMSSSWSSCPPRDDASTVMETYGLLVLPVAWQMVIRRTATVVAVLTTVVEVVVEISGVRIRILVVVVDSAGNVVVVASTVGLPTVSVKVPELAKL